VWPLRVLRNGRIPLYSPLTFSFYYFFKDLAETKNQLNNNIKELAETKKELTEKIIE
jgi:hypothetical protein